MSAPPSTSRSWSPRRLATLGLFVLLLVVAAAMFVPTFTARQAALNADAIETTGVSFDLRTDGEEVVLETTLAVENPTGADVRLISAELVATVDGTRVTGTGTSALEGRVTVPSRGTASVTTHLDVTPGEAETVRRAIEDDELALSGTLEGTIVERFVSIDVREGPADG